MRKVIFCVAAVVLGLAAGIAIAEGVLRLLNLAPSVSVVTVTADQFEALPGIFAPNQTLVDRRHRKLPHRVITDSLGYRGESFPRHKPSGEYRILMVGDSHVYGDFVDDDQTLPAQLEQQLRLRCPAVRVINAGLGGSTIVEHVRLIERALPLTPDLVILSFSENDITDLAKPNSLWDALAENRRLKSETPLALAYPILRRTALWNLALKFKARLETRRRYAPPGPAQQNDWAMQTKRLRNRYEQALVALRDMLNERRIEMQLAMYPSHLTVYGVSSEEQLSWLKQTAEENGIDAVGFLGEFRASGLPDTTLYLLPRDGHPTPCGYEIAARQLADHLYARGLPPESCGVE